MIWVYFNDNEIKRNEVYMIEEIITTEELSSEEIIDEDSVINKDFLGILQLFNPFVAHDDANRLQMLSAHLQQAIPILNPEIPLIPSIYNNEIVSNCSKDLFYETEEKTKILGKYNLLGEEFIVLWLMESNKLDILKISPEIVGDTFGTCTSYLASIGEEIEKGKPLRVINNSDNNKNLRLGVNANVAYMLAGKNFEDGLIISESFAKRTSHKEIYKLTFIINSNEYLLNIFGDKENYQCLPKVGDYINKNNRIICAKRYINKGWEAITNLSDNENRKIYFDEDSVFYGYGKIKSISILSNIENEEDEKQNIFKDSIRPYIDFTYHEIASFLSSTITFKLAHKCQLSDELNFYISKLKKITKKEKPLKFQDKEFNGYLVQIIYEDIKETQIGSKITNFHGGKGVITSIKKDDPTMRIGKIIPDSKMPVTEDGRVADIIVSPNSVIGRLNLGQIYETHLNRIGIEVVKKIKDFDSNQESLDLYLTVMKYSLPDRIYMQIEEILKNLSEDELELFFIDIVNNGLIIPQVPFESIKFENLEYLNNLLGITLDKVFIEGKEVLNPILTGKCYYIKLKHEPKKISYTNFKKIGTKTLQPAKSSNEYKKGKAINNYSPNTIGEQEFALLLGLGNENAILRELVYLKSSDKINRIRIMEKMSRNETMKISDFNNLGTVAIENLQFYLSAIGLKLDKK